MAKQTNTNSNKKEFNPSFGLWPSKSGNGFNVYVDEKVRAELDRMAVGGRLLLQEVDSDNEKAPTYRINYLPANENTAKAAAPADSI